MAKTKDKKAKTEKAAVGSLRVSGRNQLMGVIEEVEVQGLLARVVLRVGEQSITAIITSEAAKELKLRKGDAAGALVKATEVMILKA